MYDAETATYGLFLLRHGSPTICSCQHGPNRVLFLWSCIVDDGLPIWAVAELVRKSSQMYDEPSS